MTVAEKREFLEALWSIIVAFVDLGFGIHPVQQAMESRSGQIGGTENLRALPPGDVLNFSGQSPKTRFEEAADRQGDGRAER